jgi:hypothetical protein
LPNTTHITTDQNYGMFKLIYRTNLKLLTNHTTSIKPTSHKYSFACMYLVLVGSSWIRMVVSYALCQARLIKYFCLILFRCKSKTLSSCACIWWIDWYTAKNSRFS